jgi:hypothetical protein
MDGRGRRLRVWRQLLEEIMKVYGVFQEIRDAKDVAD